MSDSDLCPLSFSETFLDHKTSLVLKVINWVATRFTAFQRIDIFDTSTHGRIFALDGIVQTMENWEFMYHEMLVHVPMSFAANSEKVLVIGGGDGGTVREALKYPTVQKVLLCEIDQEVVNMAVQYLPSLSGALKDDRVSCVFEDGSVFVRTLKEKMDVIIIDSTDPTAGEGGQLFTQDFYSACKELLNDHGILAAQTENPIYDRLWMKTAFQRIRTVFPSAALYTGFSPQYPSGFWTYVVAGKKDRLPIPQFQPSEKLDLRYYTPQIHSAAFHLPPFLEEILR